MNEALPRITIYSDGGAKPNPGAGGWGAVFVRDRRPVRELSGGEADTTNNRMELTAAIEALDALDAPHEVVVHTDSRYVENGITKWIDGWRRNGWITSAKRPVQNRDLWERLDAATQRHRIRWAWVRGHAGDRFNERADELATVGRRRGLRHDLNDAQRADDAVHVYAAAAFSGKSGAGGYGVVLRFGGARKCLNGRASDTTANRMQLTSVIEGLRALKRPAKVHIYTASDYVRDGATRWIAGWRARGWRTKDGKPVGHRELWEELAGLCATHDVEWPALTGAMPEDLAVAKTAARGER